MNEQPETPKQPEPDDPFQLNGHVSPGDPDVMAECVIEEYARMGWTAERILYLFKNPTFTMPHNYLKSRGEEKTKQLINEVLERHGVFNYRVERPGDDCECSEEHNGCEQEASHE